jgi:hypothetical protein
MFTGYVASINDANLAYHVLAINSRPKKPFFSPLAIGRIQDDNLDAVSVMTIFDPGIKDPDTSSYVWVVIGRSRGLRSANFLQTALKFEYGSRANPTQESTLEVQQSQHIGYCGDQAVVVDSQWLDSQSDSPSSAHITV